MHGTSHWANTAIILIKEYLSVSQPFVYGGALNAQHKIAKADEKLNQLNEELTIDQIHYQSDAVYWNASASQARLQAAVKYQSIVKQRMASYRIVSRRDD